MLRRLAQLAQFALSGFALPGLAGVALGLAATPAQSGVLELRDNWRLQSACNLAAGGAEISTPAYQSETGTWIKTTVPATVLAAQAAAGLVPDPYFGTNLRRIPGTDYPVGRIFANLPMSPSSPYRCGWWYRLEFTPPANTAPGAPADAHHTLRFGGINYRGEIWLNGRRIADSSTIAGAYRTYDLDVTAILKPGRTNVLSVETFAPTEKDLGINWVDWNPCPPDKDMGLWGEVHLTTTGPVMIASPMAVTHLANPTPNPSAAVADLTLYAELRNLTDRPVPGTLSGSAAGARFELQVRLAPNERRTVTLSPEQFPQLRIHNPRLWWPRQMGEPRLEHLNLRFTTANGLSDVQDVNFGIREITSELVTPANGKPARLFRINGLPLLIRGAGWSPDMLLRRDEDRLRRQFDLVRDLNLNTIRLEGKLESSEFFRLADEQGILVMLGWCCCDHWEDWKHWSGDDLAIATESLRAQMLRLRSHASLLVWLNGSDGPPPADVERAYLQVAAETHWPNPILSSASAESTSVTGPSGVKMTGPYDYVAPSYWYSDTKYGGAWGFNTETSPGPSIPSLASRKRFLPDPEAWPPSEDWAFHNGSGKFAKLEVFDAAMSAVYGQADSAAKYQMRAEAMQYDSERAMFEAYSRNKYQSTGVIQWMLNNAWPSMIWHLYDYYLDTGASYFAAKKACEPIHIQYSYDDHSVVAVNSTYKSVTDLQATVRVYNRQSQLLYTAKANIDGPSSLPPDSSKWLLTLPPELFSGAGSVLFVDLELVDAEQRAVSRNFYWIPPTLTSFDWAKTDYTHTPALRHEDLTELQTLAPANVLAHADLVAVADGHEIRLRLQNRSSRIAFQIRFAIRTPSGDLIAPVFWADNWISLLPGETRILTARIPARILDSPSQPGSSATGIDPTKVVVQLSGWNIPPETLAPTSR